MHKMKLLAFRRYSTYLMKEKELKQIYRNRTIITTVNYQLESTHIADEYRKQ